MEYVPTDTMSAAAGYVSREFGYGYGDHPTAADIAKVIRADIKQAIGEGLLPAAWSYSVTSDSFSGGCSIDVNVRDCPDAYEPCDGGRKCRNVWCAARKDPVYAHAATAHYVLTEVAEAARLTLERIHGAYNHDGSEIQVDYFDVRYYGQVTFEDRSSYEFRMSERARLEARKAEREAGRIVGKVTNYKRDGSRVTHVVVETAHNKVLGCGSRSWRGAMVVRAADDAEVTCSRCAKRAGAVV